ncbi:MAG: tetratricopeptide repeat protein [bacterium]
MTTLKNTGVWKAIFVVGIIALILFCTLFSFTALKAQESTVANSKIVEEQDYAFAYGLYKDALYQLAIDQFDKFLQKYPSSLKFQDAKFLRTECVFQLELLDAAANGFSEFVQSYPGSNLADDAHFRLGETFFKQKKFNESISAFKAVLDNFGEGELAGEAAYWIGEIYIKIEDFDNALKYYTLAYDNYPRNRLRDYCVYSIAWTHQRKAQYNIAAEWYQKLLKEYPQSTLATSSTVRVGECSFYLKEYRKAIEQLESAKASLTESEQKGEADYLIGEAYYNLGEFDQARKQYEAFLASYPNHKLTREVLYALAWTLLKQNLAPQAAEAFARVEEKNDGLSHASLFWKAMAEKLAGSTVAALGSLRQVSEKNSAGEYADNALYEYGLILVEEKKLGEAKPYFEKVVAQYQSSDVRAESFRMLGECLLFESKFDEARDAFERAYASESAPFEVKVSSMYQIGWCYYKSKKYKEASPQFIKFLNSYPNHPQSHDARYWLAESEYQLGDFDGALKQYQLVASASNTEHRENALYGAGWSNLKLNEYNKAIDAFEKLVVQFPNGTFSFDSRLRLGDCYYYLKDYKKASGVYRTVIRLFPKQDGIDYAHYQLGQTFFRAGDNDQASEQFSLLIKTYPKSSLADDTQYALGWMLFQKKEYLDAVREFQKLVANYPESELTARAYYSVGDSYYNRQKYDAAERAYKELVRRFPRSNYIFDAMTGIQYCLVAQGKQEEALAVLDAFVRENPNSPVAEQLFLKKCDLLYGQKKYETAAAEYQAFIKRFPKSSQRASAQYWLGMSLAGANRSIEAAAAFDQAAALPQAPQKVVANSLFEAAAIYQRLKNFDQALNLLGRAEKGLKGTEYLSEIAYLKGAIFYENNAADEAKRQFEFVVLKHPKTISADKSRVGLARIAIANKDYAGALTLAQAVATSRTDEFGAEAQFLSGTAYAGMNDWQNAATAFLRMRYVFPKYEEWLVKAYLELGGAYEELKNVPRAKEAYQNVQKLQKEGELFNEAARRLKNLERL